MKENFNRDNKVYCIRGLSLILLVLILPFAALSQKQKYLPQKGTIDYLSYYNGFNGIFLGDSITKIPSVKLKYMDGSSRTDEEGCLKYEYTDATWEKLEDSLSIKGIGLRTWGDKIVNIYIFFAKKNGSALLGSFMSDYGTFTYRPDDYKDIYGWDSEDVKLDLMYDLNVETGVAIFTCKPMYKLMGLSKEKKLPAAEPVKTQTTGAVHQ